MPIESREISFTKRKVVVLTMHGEAGKGDNYRKVNWNKYSENYDHIFRKKSKDSGQNDKNDNNTDNKENINITVENEKTKQQ